jgi:hypothetical protein
MAATGGAEAGTETHCLEAIRELVQRMRVTNLTERRIKGNCRVCNQALDTASDKLDPSPATAWLVNRRLIDGTLINEFVCKGCSDKESK